MKIAVFYYSQTGQALEVARSICAPIIESADGTGNNSVVFKPIVSMRKYPFPWSRREFFSVFPETRLGIVISDIAEMDFSDVLDADLVMIVGQSWFLSPSMPLQSFFADKNVKSYLSGRKVVFVNACRNMWLMTSRKIKALLEDIGAIFVGHIVLQDKVQNLISALTITRWLLNGKKEATRFFPQAGISENDINEASRFGEVILNELQHDPTLAHLQDKLLACGAIDYKPSILFLEKAGHRMFGLWAKFIMKKGDIDDNRRRLRETLFFYYLLIVLFVVSPFGQLLFYATYPLHRVQYNKRRDCSIEITD